MTKYNCACIQDLLALYHDGVCSEESRLIVEEHLSQCEKCSAVAKQLSDTALETDLAGQTKGVLKTHRKRQHRKLLILSVIFGVLIIGAGLYILNLMQTYAMINETIFSYLPDVGEGAQYLTQTEYEISDDSMVTVETETMTIDIPAGYVKQDFENSDDNFICYKPTGDDVKTGVIIMEPYDLSDISLIPFTSDTAGAEEIRYMNNCLTDWFGKLGLGLPDSAYGLYKCMYLLDGDHRSADSLEQNLAYLITARLKIELCGFGDLHYIYEAEDKYGIIRVKSPNEDGDTYYAVADFYRPDDLNTPHGVSIHSYSLDEIFAIYNSIKFI